MSDLPKWIEKYCPQHDGECEKSIKLEEALLIAWEALDKINYFSQGEHTLAKDAMRRIEEIGK